MFFLEPKSIMITNMKRYSKFIFIALVVIVGAALAIFRPWQYFNLIPVIGQNAALTVNSTAGKSEVYLDDKKIGETPLSSENLKPGDYTLKIHRISDSDNFYTDIEALIHLESNTRTFVETEIGPSDQFSTLTILYYQKNKGNKSNLYLTTDPENSTIWIDDVRYGDSPVTTDNLNEGRHSMIITHEGYEDTEVTIIIREGYTLIAKAQLMVKPLQLE